MYSQNILKLAVSNCQLLEVFANFLNYELITYVCIFAINEVDEGATWLLTPNLRSQNILYQSLLTKNEYSLTDWPAQILKKSSARLQSISNVALRQSPEEMHVTVILAVVNVP